MTTTAKAKYTVKSTGKFWAVMKDGEVFSGGHRSRERAREVLANFRAAGVI